MFLIVPTFWIFTVLGTKSVKPKWIIIEQWSNTNINLLEIVKSTKQRIAWPEQHFVVFEILNGCLLIKYLSFLSPFSLFTLWNSISNIRQCVDLLWKVLNMAWVWVISCYHNDSTCTYLIGYRQIWPNSVDCDCLTFHLHPLDTKLYLTLW